MTKQRIVVVGNGMVGHHYVQTLADKKLDVEITVIGGLVILLPVSIVITSRLSLRAVKASLTIS